MSSLYDTHLSAAETMLRVDVSQVRLVKQTSYTYESTPFVVGASSGSLYLMSPMCLFNEWLIIYMWSAVDCLSLVRSMLQGNESSV